MPDLPKRKVGIIACSGEELAEGTVARLAALKVLNELRPRDTVTICLPLFVSGDAGDRAFARVHPSIAVDGCDLRCAARATEKYSNKPAASVVVNDVVAECGLERAEGRRRLNAAGEKAVDVIAERLAGLVDEVLGKAGRTQADVEVASQTRAEEQHEVTCACGSGVAVTRLTINGQAVELVALPLIFRHFRETGRGQGEDAKRDLFEAVKIYNAVPVEGEVSYREAVLKAYAAFCEKEGSA